MVFAFDTLSYARYLRERGVPQEHAEAHAEAARRFIMAELVTKADLAPVRADLAALRQDLIAVRQDLTAQFDAKLESLSLRLTVRLGALLTASVALLATLIKLT